ncbi:LysR family transcriptional regulator [Roseateles violae]|uniref:LysR family transcriptional regulator n=1 Tax=Roseateles violae TaxID=3058042 RepID=A0ABT8DMT8_9BURK|nr:LysR family transcriptional regulator [Pelomonas sp. PFR6]MDN3919707.1 LysR family transcriptional regulator [Pelomonas sp. PFR6]
MDLKRLGHLVALADTRHFARAAERVHLSQPAFSRSIQAIEQELGMRLFDRETGDVKPTPAGDFLITRARRLLFDARCLQRDALLYRDSELGDTAFGAGPFPAATIMPAVISRLRRAHPGVCLRLEMNNWQLLLERLRAEDIEFFVAEVRDIPPDPRIEIKSLGRQSAHLFVRAGHPLAGRRCSFLEAWHYGLAAIKVPGPVKALLARLLGRSAADEMALALECDDLSLLRSLALSSDTVCATSDAAVADDVRAGTLVPLELSDLPAVYSDMGLVTLRNRTPSPMAQRAIACVREVAATVNLPAPP